VIDARSTRLVRVPDLRTFRDACSALACERGPLAARDRLVIVPTRAAAAQLTRAIEERTLSRDGAVLLPDFVTRDTLYERLADRLSERPRMLNPFEREALMGVACRGAAESGHAPPFHLRPGLVAEILGFYDDLRRHENDVETFQRKALDVLEPGADADRGAERLVRQTRFLAAAFRIFEARCVADAALDEHALRARLRTTPAAMPWRHVVITVRDRASDPHGLWNCDFDLLARLPGLERIDLVVTETCLAGALHERIHQLFPGIEEYRWPALSAVEGPSDPGRRIADPGSSPVLVIPEGNGVAHVARDREEEVADFAMRVRHLASASPVLERIALVVRRPLPYVYLARDVLRSAAVPCQMFDALPLAAEPYAAALDLVFSCVSANFARTPLVALLQSPHLRFEHGGRVLDARDIAALDRALSEAGYLGEVSTLESVVSSWHGREGPAQRAAYPGKALAGAVAVDVVRELAALRQRRDVAAQLDCLLAFLHSHEAVPGPDDPLRARQLRARAAIRGALHGIRAAHAAYDDAPEEFDTVAAMVRRWIGSQTFAPRAGESGVHLLDAESARYGDFDVVQLAGLVEGEWPAQPRRSIFYSAGVLQQLGWTPEKARIEGARNAFVDLLRLPLQRLVVSTFTLEDDTVVSASPFLDEVESAGLAIAEGPAGARPRILEWEALGLDPVRTDRLGAIAMPWAEFRLQAPSTRDPRHRGTTTGHVASAFSLSALERYQDCPFKFFAADVLKLEEAPEDEPSLSPRARGRFIHEVFQRFFEAWDRQAGGTIDPARIDEARALFEQVAEPLLTVLPEAEAALERARLFGSAIAPGLVDVVLGIEASRPVKVVERWLEYRLDGDFSLGASDGRRAPLRGVADRIDLLEGRRLRVIDYKSGSAPNVKRALQVPVYALCATERLESRDGGSWTVDEAAYVAFSGRRALVPVVKAGASDPAAPLDAARARLFDLLDAVGRGEFPARPHDPMICTWCAYPSVCRKDYVGDE
jgi:RecB family exonuclease